MRRWKVQIAAAAAVVAAGLSRSHADDANAREAASFPKIVRAAKDRVFPAVVFVKCIREDSDRGKKEGTELAGSGVLISDKGELLTNWHVIDRAREIRCLLLDGRSFQAEVLGSDKDTDVALCRLRAPEGAPPFPKASLGDSDALTEGDFVMAMGAPWGMSRSISLGIVSCARRYLPGHSEYNLWIQTDASISPGNSGGPLVNTEGIVVGLNTRGIQRGGDLGFAIPANMLRAIIDQIHTTGKVQWSWTGLHLQPLHDFERDTYFEAGDGVIVAGTDPHSPAGEAGILAQDRLLAVDGIRLSALTIEDVPAVNRTLGQLALGKSAVLQLRRGTRQIEVPIVPREKGPVVGKEFACSRWDISVKSINQFERPDLFFHRNTGVFVYGLQRPGNGASAGLRRGDILLKIGSRQVRTLDELREAHGDSIASLETEHTLIVTLLRNGLYRQVVLDIGRDYERD